MLVFVSFVCFLLIVRAYQNLVCLVKSPHLYCTIVTEQINYDADAICIQHVQCDLIFN